jgi:hypothetical protein
MDYSVILNSLDQYNATKNTELLFHVYTQLNKQDIALWLVINHPQFIDVFERTYDEFLLQRENPDQDDDELDVLSSMLTVATEPKRATKTFDETYKLTRAKMNVTSSIISRKNTDEKDVKHAGELWGSVNALLVRLKHMFKSHMEQKKVKFLTVQYQTKTKEIQSTLMSCGLWFVFTDSMKKTISERV